MRLLLLTFCLFSSSLQQKVERNATLSGPGSILFSHKYSINVPGDTLSCNCPILVENGMRGAVENLGADERNTTSWKFEKQENESEGSAEPTLDHVTSSRHNFDERGFPHAGSIRFNHEINIPEQKCECERKDLQNFKQLNKNLQNKLQVLERKLLKRLKTIEQRLQIQENQKCSCSSDPIVDVIKGKKGKKLKRAKPECPKNCSGNGDCVGGSCECRRGFGSDDCSSQSCPGGCSNHGTCAKNGDCKCWGKWRGDDCSQKTCLNNCSGNGNCTSGKCECESGFSGKDCSVVECAGGCLNGRCVDGRCNCHVNWRGSDCSVKRCPRNCSGQGSCVGGRCECAQPWTGKSCSVRRCLNDCSSHGRCRNGTCRCFKQWTGDDCGSQKCLNDCSGLGDCHNGTCLCEEGWAGADCAILHCPNMCSVHGSCVEHVCECSDGWVGEDCSQLKSPSDLKISKVQSTTIEVSWKQSSRQITGNQVNCIPMSGTANAVYQSVGPNVTKVTIRDLESGTQYSVFVHSMLEDTLSAPVTASVKTAVDAPSTLNWLNIGPSFAEISWKPPKSRVDGYNVVCSCKQGGAEFSVPPNKTSVLINDLLPGDTYTVTLYALQDGDVSPPVNISFTTSLDAPEEIEFLNVTSSSAVVQWERSKARVEGYEVTFHEVMTPSPTPVQRRVSNATKWLLLSGLKPDTSYEVRMFAFRGKMRSLPVSAALVAGIEPPIRIHVTQLSTDDVTLQWDSPNSRINQFRIKLFQELHSDKGGRGKVDIVLPEGVHKKGFEQLTPGTRYVAEVYSVDGLRQSGATSKRFTTKIDAPSNLRPTRVTPTSVTVVWTAPLAAVDSLTLQCHDLRSKVTHEMRVPAQDLPEATFRSLLPTTIYNISIRSHLNQTTSDVTSIQQVTSLPAPRGLNVAMPTFDDVIVHWNPVAGLAEAGFMGFYNVTIASAKLEAIEFLTPGSSTELLVPDLTPGLTYNFTLTAQSNTPWVPSSPPATLNFIAPLDPPYDITIPAVTWNNASIMWDNARAPVTSYKVEYVDIDETIDPIVTQVPHNQTFMTLNDLSDETTYIVDVTSVMGDRSSVKRSAIFTTDVKTIEAPEFLEVVESSWNRVELEWTESPSSEVDGYLLVYSPEPLLANSLQRNLTTAEDVTSCVLTSLLPNTDYVMSIYALHEHRFSDATMGRFRTRVDPPTQLMFVTLSQRAFTLHWVAPHAHIDHYVVTYFRSDVIEERSDAMLPSSSSTYSARELQPATQYTIRVTAVATIRVHGVDNSSYSIPAVAMVTTLPSPVSRLRSLKRGVNTIAITWSPPESGEITGYDVTYHPIKDKEMTLTFKLDKDKTRFVARDLSPATEYRMSVKSTRNSDVSESRSIVEGTMISAVKSLLVRPLDDARVLVSWSPPGVAVDGYHVSHRSLDGLGDYVTKQVSGLAVSSRIDDLTADTKYSIIIRGFRAGMEGKPLEEETTTGSILESPASLVVSNIRDTCAKVTWQSLSDKTITGYLLTYKPIGGSTEDEVEENVIGRKRTSLTLTSLLPSTAYYVTLSTLRDERVSFPPKHERFVTADVLTSPTDAKVYDVTETTIGLEWKTIKSVEEYHVTYSSERDGKTSEIVTSGDDVTRILIDGLQSGRDYVISIRSFRWGEDSRGVYDVTVTTLHPLLPPAALVVESKNQTGTFVTWQSSTPDATGYDVTITSSDSNVTILEAMILASNYSTNILLPGKTFLVSVFTRRSDDRSVASTTSVQTDEPLDPPYDVTYHLVGETGALLEWQLPQQKYDVILLTLISDDGIDSNMTSLAAGVTSYVIDGLRAGKLYHVEVKCGSRGRESPASEISFTTDYIIPAPSSLRFSDVTESGVTVEWSRTSERGRHFRIVCVSEEGTTRRIILSGRQTVLPLKALQSGTTYNVSVSALDGGRESRPLVGDVTTQLGRVGAPDVTMRTSESVALTWRPLVVKVDRYDVIYNRGNSPRETVEVSNGTSVNVTGLLPGETYNFKVVARKGNVQSRSTQVSAPTELDPPSDLRTILIGRRSVNVTWQPARAQNVTGFDVTLRILHQSIVHNYNVTTSHVWLRHLSPNATYVISVATRRHDDVSKVSNVTFKTASVPFPRPRDCAQVLMNGEKTDGVYQIYVTNTDVIKVWCDLGTDGGGWIVVQRRSDGSVDFNRGWNDYVTGFGGVGGELWIGLETLHFLTQQTQELRIDLRHNDVSVYAKYLNFRVGDETSDYVIQGRNYSGNAGDSLSYHFGMKFTTRDVDNDEAKNRNCADEYQGAWWFKNCHRSSLNGQYNNQRHSQGINWFTWGGFTRSVEWVEMKIRPQSLRQLKRRSARFAMKQRRHALKIH